MPEMTITPQTCPHQACLQIIRVPGGGIDVAAPPPTDAEAAAWCPDCGSIRTTGGKWQTICGMSVTITCRIPEGVDVSMDPRQ